jgi:hypothetical protein
MSEKIIKINKYSIEFTNNLELYSSHEQACCEEHYLDFSGIDIEDVRNLEFDLNSDDFLEKIEGYGIRLLPKNGLPLSIPGYSNNNGYYSDNLLLKLSLNDNVLKKFDITNCQS